MESDNSSSDSNYTPKTKWKKSASSNLKEPSKSRLQSQKMIEESKRHHLLGSSDAANYPVLPDDEERNKRCPLCPATFYFETGVATHVAHTHGQHAGEMYVMGVNTSAKSDVMGINNATQIQHTENTVTGRNESAKETSAPIVNPTVNDANDQTVNATPPQKAENTNDNKVGQNNISDKQGLQSMQRKNWNHKCRPKPFSKHARPQPTEVKDTVPTESSKITTKPQFVTVTHRIRKT